MKPRNALRIRLDAPYRFFTGVGGIGSGMFFALEGDATLGRNESRPAKLLDVRDYCKLHIIAHYFSVFAGGGSRGEPWDKRLHVLPVGKVGEDDVGKRLRLEMAAAGMDTRYVDLVKGHPTLLSVCFQYPDGSGGNITTRDAAASEVTVEDVGRAEKHLSVNAGRAIALAAPEAPLEARKHLLELATKHRALRAASFATAEIPAAVSMGILPLVDILAANEDEAAAVVGEEFDASDPAGFLQKLATAMQKHNPNVRILLSAGGLGAYGFEEGSWSRRPAPRVNIASTAGAGDALFGGVLAALAAQLPFITPGTQSASFTEGGLHSALDFGVLLASFSVTSPHTIHPDANLPALVEFGQKLGVAFGDQMTGAISQ